MNWLKRRLRAWLGCDTDVQLATELAARALSDETVAREALAEQVLGLVSTCHGLAQALQAAVAQLNRNTLTMQRWSKESATLEAIERRHAIKEAAPTNGGRIVTLPPGSTL